jgi:predicted N-acetyltransferase YhbS
MAALEACAAVSEVAIREAAPADCVALSRLIDQLGYRTSEAEVARRLAEMQGACRLVLVAELGGEVIGCLSTSIMQVLHRPKPVGRISMMVVDETLRGQGIGRALVRAAERRLVEQGCGLVEVTSNLVRTEAHRFYEKLGYERTSYRFAIDPEDRA